MKSIHSTEDIPVYVITPPNKWVDINFQELWQQRELLFFLTWRDVKVKYKQALLGFAWAILVPFLQMIVFGLIFGKFAGMPTNGLDPFIFYFAGLVPWTYFATALSMSSISMSNQAKLLTKIYLPRLFIPSAACFANLIDFMLAFVVLLLVMLFMGLVPSITTLLIPLIMVIALTTALGVGFYVSALNVKYRDIKFAIPFLIQIWMYVTVIVPYHAIPEAYQSIRYLMGLNPMACVVEGTRWCLAHHYMTMDEAKTQAIPFPFELFLLGVPVAVLILLFGLAYFRKMERTFADVV